MPVLAQVTVKVNAPQQAFTGRQIQVSYMISTQDVDNFQVGDFVGFDVLYGPSRSSSSSIQIVNGKMSQSSTLSMTYVIRAEKAGTFKLPVATVKSDGNTYKSNVVSIQILDDGNGNSSQGGTQRGSGANTMRTQDVGERISSKDLYIAVTASKHHLYEQEAVLLTYKLYTLVSIDQCMGKMPELDGFHIQEIELPQQKTLKYERINGRNYGTVVWSQYVLFPQKTGKLTVPAINFECDVVQENRSMDPFEAFFGGGSSLVRVKKTVVAPAVELQVDALPTRPTNFSGAVGNKFNISGKLTPEQVDANDAVSMRLVLNGVGNMKLVKAPIVQWPKDFETYDPKTLDKTKIGAQGASGNVVFDYTAVPRHGGKYVIPPIEFCYFDPSSKAYKTVRTDSFTLAVAKGVGPVSRSDVNQEDLKVLNSDIRYIKTSPVSLVGEKDSFFLSLKYWMIYVASFVIFVLFWVVFRNRVRANSNVAHRRRRKAGKAAVKRLKTAAKLMRTGQDALFYDEVMKAMWGYVGDKLNLPVADLNKDNIAEQLQNRGVDESATTQFLNVLEECEFARFAPDDPKDTMEKLFNVATDVINQIDVQIR